MVEWTVWWYRSIPVAEKFGIYNDILTSQVDGKAAWLYPYLVAPFYLDIRTSH